MTDNDPGHPRRPSQPVEQRLPVERPASRGGLREGDGPLPQTAVPFPSTSGAGVRPIIGRGSATEAAPNTSERFQSWLAPDALVNPFDIVEAEHLENSRTYGLVTEIRHTTDAPSHLANVISADFGDVLVEPQTPRQGADIVESDVLANHNPDDPHRPIYMPVRSGAPVRFADEHGIQIALGIDRIEAADRIPAGVVSMSNGTMAVTPSTQASPSRSTLSSLSSPPPSGSLLTGSTSPDDAATRLSR
jgi:hypothetical protein